MTSTFRLSPLLLAVTLSPAMLQQVDCEATGNATLASLEIEAAGLPRVVGFSGSVTAYDVWTTAGVDTILVSASTVVPGARVNYRLTTGGELTTGSLGIGGGQATLSIVPDSISTLQVDVSDGSTRKLYVIDLNPLCSGSECTDNDSCTADACIGSTCSFSTEPDGTTCDFASLGDGTCNAGVCEAAPVLVLEQASKQVGGNLECPNLSVNGDYSFELSPLLVESDANHNVSLSGQLRVVGPCPFLVPPIRLDSAEVTVSVTGAAPVTLTAFVDGLPAQVPDTGSNCDGLFDLTVVAPTEMSLIDTTVEFIPTDIAVAISQLTNETVDAGHPFCDLVANPALPSSVSFSVTPYLRPAYPICLTAEEIALADAINKTRVANALDPVPVDTRLVQTSRANAEQFAFNLTYACPVWPCYGYPGSYADNGAGFMTAEAFWDAIVSDTTNPVRIDAIQNYILSPTLRHLGVGYYYDPASQGQYTRGWSFAAGTSIEEAVLDGSCDP